MPLGFTAAARSKRTTRPRLQVPAVVTPPPPDVDPPPIGGTGGGTAPTAPSPITAGVPANQLFGWGGNFHSLAPLSTYDKWKADFGFNGYLTKSSAWHLTDTLENMTLQFWHSGTDVTAIVDPLLISGSYNTTFAYHHSWFGNQAPPIEGGTWGLRHNPPGFGIGDYKRAHPDFKFIIGMYARPTAAEADTPYMGDWYDDAHWVGMARSISNLAAGAKFVGADGLGFDNESSGHFFALPCTSTTRPTNKPNSGGQPLNVGFFIVETDTGRYYRWTGTAWELHTQAELFAKCEARGYQFGQGVYNAYPDCQFFQYEWNVSGGSYGSQFDPTNYPGIDGEQTQFYYGMWRAAKDANVGRPASKCKWYLWDPQWYEMTHTGGTSATAQLQRIQQNVMALRSQRLQPAVRDFMLSRFAVMLPSWSYGSTSNRGYWYPIPETEYANTQALYRSWSMDGWRSEYLNGPGPANDAVLGPMGGTGSPLQNYFTDTRTNPPGGHQAGLLTAAQSAAVNPHPSSVAPTLSATVSGSGTTRTISGSAAHLYGIWWIRAYIYPNGTPVYAAMTLNEAGGTTSTNFNNVFMTYTLTLTGVTGGYAIVQAHGIMGHEKSLTVSLGGTGTIPFRLFADTSLWNTTKTSLTFDADADATLSGLTYGINNTSFCHPFFRGVATDPTWTITATEDHWGHGPRTVTIKAPTPMSHASGSDGVLTVLDSTTGTLWDMYGVAAIDNTAHTITTPMLVDSDGVNGTGFGNQQTFASVGTAAIGIAQASGTILATDVNNGIIPHGLFMAFDYTNSGGTNTSGSLFVPPAVFQDIGGATGPIPQGGLMVAQGTEPVGLNAMEHQLWLACTTYGVYNCDQLGGHPQFYGDGSTLVANAFTDAGLTAIGRKLRLVRTSW